MDEIGQVKSLIHYNIGDDRELLKFVVSKPEIIITCLKEKGGRAICFDPALVISCQPNHGQGLGSFEEYIDFIPVIRDSEIRDTSVGNKVQSFSHH